MAENIYDLYNIDLTKLKRDYIKEPLKWVVRKTGGYSKERPYKEDIIYLYNELNMELRDVLNYFDVKCSTFYTFLKEFNIKKTTSNRRNNNEKALMRLYGVKNQFQRDCVKRYCNTKDAMMKKFLTMSKNKTFNKSNNEEYIYKKLQQKFTDVKRQYKSNVYPYRCDFYLPSIDTYIEYNGHWSHGFEPYIGSKEQLEKVKLWESKSKELNIFNKHKDEYSNAIDVWTRRDVEKLNKARENNLSYLVFYNMTQFTKWFRRIVYT